MLANVKTVKQFVKSVADMQSTGWERRIWQDRNKRDATLRNVAFRFWDSAEADAVAEQLTVMLFAAGYTNKVKRTSKQTDYISRTSGGEYVRVISAM
jgi:hypothetical protein